MRSTKELMEILSSTRAQYSEHTQAALEIKSSGNRRLVQKAANNLGKVMQKNSRAGGDFRSEPIVECGQAMIILGKPSVKPLLRILESEKDRQIYLYSQQAMQVACLALAAIGDESALPRLRKFHKYCQNLGSMASMYVINAVKSAIIKLEKSDELSLHPPE